MLQSSWKPKDVRRSRHLILESKVEKALTCSNRWRDAGRILPAVITAIVIIGGFDFIPAQSKDPEIARISSLLEQSDNASALSAADLALVKSPRSCPILSLRAMALQRLNRVETALAGFSKALSVCPHYLPALEGAAEIEYSHGAPDTPQLLRRILAVDAGNVTAHAMLASLFGRRNDCKAALPEFEASKPLFATRPELAQGYGSCLAREGRYNEALAVYVDLLGSNPSPAIRYDVALLQLRTKSYDEALGTVEPLITANYAPALALASRIYEERGDTPHSVALLRSAIVSDPTNIDYYLDFASIAFSHRSFQVGIDMLNSGITQLPKSAVLLIARGVLEVQLGNNELAIADFERAHQLDPKLSYVDDALGMMRTQEHEGGKSLEFFRSAVQLHPNDAFLQYLLAEQLSQAAPDLSTEAGKAAIIAAKNAVRLDPKYAPAHDLLARLYVGSNQFALAIEQAEAALAQDPNDESALYQEIMARKHTGNLQGTKALVARLQAARQANAEKKQITDRYRLLEEDAH
jgi:tetratricopeptide (TPR) repeat protein